MERILEDLKTLKMKGWSRESLLWMSSPDHLLQWDCLPRRFILCRFQISGWALLHCAPQESLNDFPHKSATPCVRRQSGRRYAVTRCMETSQAAVINELRYRTRGPQSQSLVGTGLTAAAHHSRWHTWDIKLQMKSEARMGGQNFSHIVDDKWWKPINNLSMPNGVITFRYFISDRTSVQSIFHT